MATSLPPTDGFTGSSRRDSISLSGDVFDRATRRAMETEWRHVNDTGSWAASTAGLVHTCGDHGLLVAPTHVGPTVILAQMELRALPIVSRPGAVRRTLADHLDGTEPVEPMLLRFAQHPLPEWTLAVDDERGETAGDLEMTLALHPTERAVAFRWTWHGETRLQLQLRPLLSMRAVIDRARAHGAMSQVVEVRHGEARVQPRRDLPRVCFGHEGMFVGSPDWWQDRASRLPFAEDLWTPGVIEVCLQAHGRTHLVCALDALPELDASSILAAAHR